MAGGKPQGKSDPTSLWRLRSGKRGHPWEGSHPSGPETGFRGSVCGGSAGKIGQVHQRELRVGSGQLGDDMSHWGGAIGTEGSVDPVGTA